MELQIVKFFNTLGGRWLSLSASFTSYVSVMIAMWLLISSLVLYFDQVNGRVVFLALVIASVFHFAISEGFFKFLLPVFVPSRKRPYQAFPSEITAHGINHKDASFPSSHMSANAALLLVLVYFYPITLLPALLFMIFMAYARMHNGMHYPSDILGGTILGILYGLVAVYLVR